MSCAEDGDTNHYQPGQLPGKSGRSHTSASPRLPPGAATKSKRQDQAQGKQSEPVSGSPQIPPDVRPRHPWNAVTAGAPGFYQRLPPLSISHIRDSCGYSPHNVRRPPRGHGECVTLASWIFAFSLVMLAGDLVSLPPETWRPHVTTSHDSADSSDITCAAACQR